MSKKGRILIVDDEEPIRAFYAEELRDEGYDPIATDDAMHGLELIEKGEVDLVILDIRMPKMDGRDFLSRAREINIALPIIISSAYPSYKQDFGVWGADAYLVKDDGLVDSSSRGANAHFVKSANLTELKEKIAELLSEPSEGQ